MDLDQARAPDPVGWRILAIRADGTFFDADQVIPAAKSALTDIAFGYREVF